MKSVIIPNSVTKLEDSAFEGCYDLVSVTLGDAVTHIGPYAFYGCSRLSSFSMPHSVISLGEKAFSSCGLLEEITLSDKLESIENETFYGCGSLISVNIPNSVTSIGNRSFVGCGFSSLDIPTSVTSIGEESFFGCRNLITLTIGNNVETIGDRAFSSCTSLESLIIPNSVRNIGNNAFYHCDNLVSVKIGDFGNIDHPITNIGDNAFYYCIKLTSVIIGNSVASIGNYSFFHCDNLSSVTISSSVETIGDFVFYNCGNLSSVTCFATTPPSLSIRNPFYLISDNATLHVIPECKPLYLAAEIWKDFSVIVDDATLHSKTIELSDDVSSFCQTETEKFDIISYTRTFNNTNWQALYVPFSMNYEDWADEYEMARLNDVHQFDDDEDGDVDRTELEVIKMKGGSTEPNTPYVIKAKETGEKTLTLNNTTLYATEENSIDCSSVGTLYTFTGIYHTIPGSEMMTRGYYAFGGGSLIQAASEASNLGAFRWYLAITDRSGASKAPKKINVRVKGEDTETGILSVENERADDVVYDMNGRKVMGKNLKPGVYVRNGKKFVVR